MSNPGKAETAPKSNGGARRRWLMILGVVVLVGALLWGLYWLLKPDYRVAVAEVDKTTNASPGELNPYVNITGVDCQKR